MTVSIRDPKSPFERHVRLLLRAYPPEYRRDRGEEILGTLLEAGAEGQEWPSFRDSRSLLAGGIRARADRNRAVGLAASLRLAAILGLSIYLTQTAVSSLFLASLVRDGTGLYARSALELAAIGGAWLGFRTLTALAAAAAIAFATITYAGAPVSHQLALLLPVALSLAALAVLTRRAGRPPVDLARTDRDPADPPRAGGGAAWRDRSHCPDCRPVWSGNAGPGGHRGADWLGRLHSAPLCRLELAPSGAGFTDL